MYKAKILSVILALVLLSTVVLPCFASDVKPEIKYAQGGKIEGNIVDISRKNIAKPHYTAASSAFFSKQTVTSRETLTDDEKEIYDYFKNAPFGTTEYYVEYEDYETAPPYSYYDNLNFANIMNAITLDCPDLFYLEGCKWRYSWYEINGSDGFGEGDKLYRLQIIFNYDTSMGDIDTLKEKINSKLETLDVSKCHNRYDIIKTFHQFLCTTADYDFDYLERFDKENPEYVKHNIIGTLIDGKCVCQGYAESFKMLCDLYKIPCICVEGEADGGGHEWNAVLMDDGKWYLMDVTWDDTTGTSNYFLQSKSYFDSDHEEILYSYSPRVTYSTTKFDAPSVLTEFAATYNCRASKTRSGNFLYRSVFDVNEPIYCNGLWLKDCTAAANGAKFTAPSGSSYANENWQLILIGDVNGDGECTAADYSAAVTKALNGEAGYISASNMAADADFDGYLDVLDVVIIERMTTGANTQIVIS